MGGTKAERLNFQWSLPRSQQKFSTPVLLVSCVFSSLQKKRSNVCLYPICFPNKLLFLPFQYLAFYQIKGLSPNIQRAQPTVPQGTVRSFDNQRLQGTNFTSPFGMQRLEARQLKCFSLSLWTSPGTTKTHPNKQPPKRPRKSKTIGQKQGLGKKGKQFGWKEKMDEKILKEKEVKRRNTSFGWKKLGRLHVNGLVMAYWSPLFWVLTQDFTFHTKIGSGFPGMTCSTRWNQPNLISVVPSLGKSPKIKTLWVQRDGRNCNGYFLGARGSSNFSSILGMSFIVAYFNSLNQSACHPMILSISIQFPTVQEQQGTPKTIGWFGLSTKWFGDQCGHSQQQSTRNAVQVALLVDFAVHSPVIAMSALELILESWLDGEAGRVLWI